MPLLHHQTDSLVPLSLSQPQPERIMYFCCTSLQLVYLQYLLIPTGTTIPYAVAATPASQVVAKLKPHTLVLNAGLWRRQFPDWPTALYDRIFEAANLAVAPQVGTEIALTVAWCNA